MAVLVVVVMVMDKLLLTIIVMKHGRQNLHRSYNTKATLYTFNTRLCSEGKHKSNKIMAFLFQVYISRLYIKAC